MQTSIDWQYVYPQGMEKIVTYVKNRYNNTPIFITENGMHNPVNPLMNRVYVFFYFNKLFFRVWRVGQPK
jgi:hypothetical protein